MQHPCSRCGAAVDDSSAFCPSCEAPQVYFVPRETTPEEVRLHPAIVPVAAVATAEAPQSTFPVLGSSDRPRWLRAAAYAGAVGVVLSFLPTGPPLALPVAGWLAVRFYTRMARFSIRAGDGFRLGALCGLLVYAVFFSIGAIAMAVLSARGELRQTMLEVANRAHSMNPNVRPEDFVNLVTTPSGLVLVVLFSCALFVLLASLGGLVSAALSGRRDRG